MSFLVNPNGCGITNTNNRAEMAVVWHDLSDMATLDRPVTVFTDSLQHPATGGKIPAPPC